MNVGIIGLGYWGPNLVRNFLSQKNIDQVFVFDQNTKRVQAIKQNFPKLIHVNSFNDLMASNVDAIVIATPVGTHFKLAKKSLEAGKHTWVEKPMTSTSKEAIDLINLAESKNLKLFVDHTYLYTDPIKKMKELIEKDELGDVNYFDSVRINLGLFQHDVNVIWDLAPHDLSIMNYLIPNKKVVAVSANGIANYYDQENIAHLSIYCDNNCFAHFHVNWTSPVKIRRMIVGGMKKMLVFNDMENFENIKIYDCGVRMNTDKDIHEALVQYRIGDMYSPKVTQTEALSLAAKEFIDSIIEDKIPLTSGVDGLNVVRILEASEKSLARGGSVIYLEKI
jgi:predicted dehydrogenase